MANFSQLYQSGFITLSFKTAANPDRKSKSIDLGGLNGKELDYALVEYEQTQVQKFIDGYFSSNPRANKEQIFSEINSAFAHPFAPREIQAINQSNFTDKNIKFDFTNYEHRVILGNKLVHAKRSSK